MTKKRKSLDDSLAEEFVFGAAAPPSMPEPVIEPDDEDDEEPAQAIANTPAPKQPKQRKPASKLKTQTQTRNSIVSQLLESAEQKEATVRLTVDLTETMHRKLSLLSARSGKKKAVIVRMLLEEALQEVDE
ncbi:CopG family transcriptional regulator [Leptolyngbya ohadii]|uniref:CopG family transcriptional regulator n=1 Tax=Leptolyngbya ohadii TaxID=1962290 RepID=UPI000B59D2C7|nr:CopG family transcriptional regulator [Leptolyngbya ohadii]